MKYKDKDILILFEDNHLLVLDKPAGLLTQPSTLESLSLETIAKQWIKERDQKKAGVFLEAVHRIDRPVSGIVIFAKSQKALKRLMAQVRERGVVKIYQALVEGHLLGKKGTLVHYLEKEEYRARVDANGKKCVLDYEVLFTEGNATCIKIYLGTGRYHQIRAQFAAIGHPIVGDQKYGAKTKVARDGIALCQVEMGITHPVTQERLTFLAEWCA